MPDAIFVDSTWRLRAHLSGYFERILSAVSLLIVFMILFAIIQFSTQGLVGHDGYYHVKMAYIMHRDGLTPAFIWLPKSILSSELYVDHHFLFHVYLMLFISPDSTSQQLIYAAKVSSIVMPSLAFVAVWWLLREHRIRWPELWTLGLFSLSSTFLYRMSMPRAQSASLLVLVLALHFILKQQYFPLALLAFIYVWLYDAFPLILIEALLYLVSNVFLNRKFAWQPVLVTSFGVSMGTLFHPYFPQNAEFYFHHLVAKIGEIPPDVGTEWYPYDTWQLAMNSGGALCILIAGFMALGFWKEKIDLATCMSMLLAIFFGLLTLRSRRFIEYFPAFALIFAAMSISKLVSSHLAGSKKWLLPIGLFLSLAFPFTLYINDARSAVISSAPPDLYAEAAHWLAENSSPGDVVFQTDWDDFPYLFFHNTSNSYTIGLDTSFMQMYSAALYDEFVNISQGKIYQPSCLIAANFEASYVFSDLEHVAFFLQSQRDPGLEVVYRDHYAIIYQVSDDHCRF